MKRFLLTLVILASHCTAADVSAFRSGNDLVLCFERLDMWRQSRDSLQTQITLANKKTLTLDLAEPAITNALTLDLGDFGPCEHVSVRVGERAYELPVPLIELPVTAHAQVAEMERGTQWTGELPRIALPDAAALRGTALALPTRAVKLDDITFPVVAERDLPVLGSQNMVLLSGGSIWFSYRKGRLMSAHGE